MRPDSLLRLWCYINYLLKALLVTSSCVSSAIASTRPLPFFTFTYFLTYLLTYLLIPIPELFQIYRQVVTLRTSSRAVGVPRQSMSGTRHEVEELRNGEDEVEDLWDEEEQHRLTEVAEDGDDSERHSGKVAVGVADKHSCWIPDNGKLSLTHCSQ